MLHRWVEMALSAYIRIADLRNVWRTTKETEYSEYVLLKYKIGPKNTGVLTMSTDRKYAGLPDLVSSKAQCIAPSQALMYVIGSCTRYL